MKTDKADYSTIHLDSVINPIREQAIVLCVCCGNNTEKEIEFVEQYASTLRDIINEFEENFNEKFHRQATSEDLIYVLSERVHYNVRDFLTM